MAITPDNTADASDFIYEAEVDPTPSNDNGRVAKLEPYGGEERKIHPIFHPHKIDIFDANGVWTKPEGATYIIVELWGGGASGGSTNNNSQALGGGGGEYLRVEIPAYLLGATENVVVGQGGASVTGSNPGNNGGDSTFGTSIIFATANGGTANLGGTGGTELLSNPKKENGGNGGSPTVAGISTNIAGAGGGGIDGTSPNPFSNGGNSLLGGDGGDANATGNDGDPGQAPGGGGGAADLANSGAGANGRVRVTTIF